MCTVSQEKIQLFYFCDYSVKCWPILIIFGNIAAAKICNLVTYSFLIISRLCINITEYKNKKDSVCFLCCHFILSFITRSPHVHSLFRNFLLIFITFRHVQIFHQNRILVAETHVYTKSLTSNRRLLPKETHLAAVEMCAFHRRSELYFGYLTAA